METCAEYVKKVADTINNTKDEFGYFGYSYNRLDRMNKSKELEKYFDFDYIESIIKPALIEFLDILFDYGGDIRNEHRKLYLEKTKFVEDCLFIDLNYILSIHYNDIKAYRELPEYIKMLIEKYKLTKYMNLSYDDIFMRLVDSLDMIKDYDKKWDKDEIKINLKPIINADKYKTYNEKVKKQKVDHNNQDEFFIWAEYQTYINEYNNLKSIGCNPDLEVKWVAKNNGDGYGYDILSYDYITNKEKLIEVKSGFSKDIILTEGEMIKAYRSIQNPNYDYYVYKYYYDYSSEQIKTLRLKYDKENLVFKNIDDPYDEDYIMFGGITQTSNIVHNQEVYASVLPRSIYEEWQNREIVVRK